MILFSPNAYEMPTDRETLSAPEAERLVQNLKKIKLQDYGNDLWHQQHEALERLTIQVH